MNFYNEQFTYYNKPEVEEYLKEVLTKAAIIFKNNLDEENLAALILIGGYGRGEGGVLNKDGVFKPHNNLDLLYIYNGNYEKEKLEKIDAKLQEIAQMFDIGIDMSSISKEKLLSLKGYVMHYDMRFGHRTLLGDSSFLKNHEEFSLMNINPSEIRQLLVNRGTLLLINKALLYKKELTQVERKLIVKHAIKAIIGYGDALLYFHGKYHWSYAQKLHNMMESEKISKEVKKLYSDAIAFRFQPNYSKFDDMDLYKWNDELLQELSSIHLLCEKAKLQNEDITWDNYLFTALEKENFRDKSFKQKVKGLLESLTQINLLFKLDSFRQIRNYILCGNRGMMSLIFPYIAYDIYPKNYKNFLDAIVKPKSDTSKSRLHGFLRLWSIHGDPNFKNVLRTYNIELE